MPIPRLFDNNRDWRDDRTTDDPDFFKRLSRQQAPDFLWIGCSDSRVPANDIVGLDPGELFVHRNVANLVVPNDMNLLAVLQYAVEALEVRDIIVTGHYGCGGVRAAVERSGLGIVDNWLGPIKQLYRDHRDALESIRDPGERLDRLCELNVVQQVHNLAATTIVHDAWSRRQPLGLHGWIYSLKDGLLKSVGCTVTGPDQLRDMPVHLRRL
jgi:carbonic anhydrase